MVYGAAAMGRRALLLLLTTATATACGGNVNLGGIYFAPWMACVMGGAVGAYTATRLLERHLFDYDPRYFAWAFLPLTAVLAFALWFVFARA